MKDRSTLRSMSCLCQTGQSTNLRYSSSTFVMLSSNSCNRKSATLSNDKTNIYAFPKIKLSLIYS